MQIKAQTPTQITIAGDSGKDYAITADANGSAHCTCPSFRYQTRACKHIMFAYAQTKGA